MLGLLTARRFCAILVMLCALPPGVIQGQTQAQTAAHNNETLTYNIEWRLITAGMAKVQRTANQLNVRIESAGLVSKLYKVDDTYNTTYEGDLCTTSIQLNAQEGRRKRDTRVTFDRQRKKADYLERDLIKNVVVKQDQIDVPACVHDIAGALAELRVRHIEVGRSDEIAVSDGKKWANVRVEAQEREVIKVKDKPVKTVRYEAFIFNGVIYSRRARLLIWLTDDAAKLPVQIQARMSFPVGTVTLTLDKEEH